MSQPISWPQLGPSLSPVWPHTPQLLSLHHHAPKSPPADPLWTLPPPEKHPPIPQGSLPISLRKSLQIPSHPIKCFFLSPLKRPPTSGLPPVTPAPTATPEPPKCHRAPLSPNPFQSLNTESPHLLKPMQNHPKSHIPPSPVPSIPSSPPPQGCASFPLSPYPLQSHQIPYTLFLSSPKFHVPPSPAFPIPSNPQPHPSGLSLFPVCPHVPYSHTKSHIPFPSGPQNPTHSLPQHP